MKKKFRKVYQALYCVDVRVLNEIIKRYLKRASSYTYGKHNISAFSNGYGKMCEICEERIEFILLK